MKDEFLSSLFRKSAGFLCKNRFAKIGRQMPNFSSDMTKIDRREWPVSDFLGLLGHLCRIQLGLTDAVSADFDS